MTDTPISTLEPLSPPRRRRWGRIAIAVALVAQSAALYAALARESTTKVVTHVERTTTTRVLALPPLLVPQAAPPATLDPRACPTPRTDAPTIVPPELPELVHDLAVSPTNAGWIAAWNDQHVFVSTDAGRTFQRRLDGIGRVRAVQFDCFGRAIAIRGDKLGVVDDLARETWRSVPGIDLAIPDPASPPNVALVGGGRDVIVVGLGPGDAGRLHVAISRDLGTSWTYHAMADYSEPAAYVAGVQRADGTILVGATLVDCMTNDLAWLEISPRGTVRSHWHAMSGVEFQFSGDSIISRYARRSLLSADADPWDRLTPEDDAVDYGTLVPAPYPVFVEPGDASRLVGTTLRPYRWQITGDHHQMDPAGRLWSIACGQPWIARHDRTRDCG